MFVTAAGNNSADNDTTPTYPASYRTPNELVVAAINEQGELANYFEIMVRRPSTSPRRGSDIFSTVPGGFATYSGTSMATAFVTGSVALVDGVDPNLSALQMVSLIKSTAKPDYALNGLMNTPATVDPYNALLAVDGNSVTTTPSGSPTLTPRIEPSGRRGGSC